MSEKTKAGVKKGKTFSFGDISLFCAQLSMLLRSSIPAGDGVAAIAEDVEDQNAKRILIQMEDKLSAGAPLYEALRDSGAFPSYMVNMVEIGEKAGKLDDVLDALSRYYEREDALKKRVKSAVVYPFILVLMMAVVIAVLVVKVLPVFNQVFENLGSEVSGSAGFVMTAGVAIGKYAFLFILLLAVVLLVFYVVTRTKKGSVSVSHMLSRFVLTRKLSKKIAAARFASVFSMLLSSGYSTDEALELIPNILDNNKIVQKVKSCRALLQEGSSFVEAVEKTALFDGVYSRMVGIGSKTGNLDTVMKKLAGLYEEEIDASIDKTVSTIEPVLVGILSVVIGAILLSVMLPLMSIMSSIG